MRRINFHVAFASSAALFTGYEDHTLEPPSLREQAGLSQRDLAKRLGVSQPRIATIERSKNVTVELLEQYVEALGGRLRVTVVKGNKHTTLISSAEPAKTSTRPTASAIKAPANKAARRSPARAAARRSA